MNLKTILQTLQKQKKALIKRIPHLQYHFVDIYHPTLKVNIPFLPIRCFRDFYIYQHDEENNLTTFISSGSTNSIRARHSFSPNALNVFAKNTSQGFEKFLERHHLKNVVIISLVPPPSEWPNSSLSRMIKMFENHGFCLKWCNIENIETEKIASLFLNELYNLSPETNVIVFGTTFHHLLLIQNFRKAEEIQKKEEIFKKINISLMDTGGTKGKTQAFSLNETKNIFCKFYSKQDSRKSQLKIFSEYGMCELGSQAWSLSANHNGTFVPNESLFPFSIDLNHQKILPAKKTGFLGFIDTVNTESYGAIITEDLGMVLSSRARTFKLIGRAPDASIKGCSLNVKNFKFTENLAENPPLTLAKISFHKKRKKLWEDTLKARTICENLNKKYWNPYDISDFKKSFSSLKNSLRTNKFLKNEFFNKKNMLLICAANTPISFVYPAILCAINGVNSFTLKIPSLRPNDLLNHRIRLQIINLYECLSKLFPHTTFFMSESKSLENNFAKYNCVMVFGNDETLSILQEKCSQHTSFFGFGDIKNAIIVNTIQRHRNNAAASFSKVTHTPKFLAQLCSAWNGRGCLTPVCLFIPQMHHKNFISSFFKIFSKNMKERFKTLKDVTFHDHNSFFIQSQMKRFGYEPSKHIMRSKWVTIVNLIALPSEIIHQMSLDFSFGGSGFVFLLPFEMRNEFKNLSFKPVFPTIYDFQTSFFEREEDSF